MYTPLPGGRRTKATQRRSRRRTPPHRTGRLHLGLVCALISAAVGLVTPAAADDLLPACPVSATLVPSCGAWWGVAPGVFTGLPVNQALPLAEQRMGRQVDIVHLYQQGDQQFPTAAAREMARYPQRPRLLLINWKPSLEHSWAQIAAGAVDGRLDRLAAHIRATFPERFFLTIHHEPENDVRAWPGSGYTADDYRNMVRHVVLGLRARGIHNAITVMTYMGAPNWVLPWFDQLYPGDDVVDWIGLDPYADQRVETFAQLVNKTRPDYPGFPGFYTWAQRAHPGKPLMVAEWGAFDRPDDQGFKQRFYDSVRQQLPLLPAIRALVYFESPRAPRGDTRFDTSSGGWQAFAELARDPYVSTAIPPAN